ncbi:MAG: DNA primase [Bacteriovoracales bacterium]|nr:DNA primase [Bacteriovoracales bacterium]
MSSDLLTQIKSIPASEIIGHYISLKRRGRHHTALCPFHQDKNPSLNVNDSMGIFKCFSCEVGGDVLSFVQKYKNIPFKEAMIDIAEKFNLSTESLKSSKSSHPKYDRALRLNKAALKIFCRCGQSNRYPPFFTFMEKRGLSQDTVTRFALGYAPGDNVLVKYILSLPEEDGKKILQTALEIGLIQRDKKVSEKFYDTFQNRIMFPIKDPWGNPIGFGSRAVLSHQKGKYINSKESFLFNKKNVLYGLHLAKQSIRDKSQAILVEGYMDCLSLAQNGFPNVVAVMGVAAGASSVKTLSRMAKDILLGLDSDPAGHKAKVRANDLFLEEGLLPRDLDYTPHKDPDEFLLAGSRIDLMERIEKAPTFLDTLVEKTLGKDVPKNMDRKLALLGGVFDLVKPLKKSLSATERILNAAQRLKLQSTKEQILSIYEERLSSAKPSSRPLPAPPPPDGPTADFEDEGSSPPPSDHPLPRPLSKIDRTLLRFFALHPDCLPSKKAENLLEYASHSEVKRSFGLLKNAYLELDEGAYRKMAPEMLQREGLDPLVIKTLVEGIANCVFWGLDDETRDERAERTMNDLTRRLERERLIQERDELKKKNQEHETDLESKEYLARINKIEQDRNKLQRLR